MKKEHLVLISIIILALSILGSAALISGKDTYIKSLGSSTLENDKLLNTITVTGDGIVYAKPDTVSFSVTVSELKNTVKEAQEETNKKVSRLKEMISKNNIPEDDIVTSNYSIYPEYDYNINNESKVIGHRASQTIQIKVKGIDEKATKAVTLIDEISGIEKIEISAITFDIEDKTSLFSQARELAFAKAEQKAKELAKLSNVKLLSPVSISDASYDYTPITSQYKSKEMALNTVSDTTPSDISTGQLDISISLNIVFGIE